jgi:phosphoribosylanthranilate isomerase
VSAEVAPPRALSLSTDPERVLRTAEAVEPSIVHVARAVNGLEVDAVGWLRGALAPVQLMVTIPVRDASSVVDAQRFGDVADYLLLDSMHPTTGVVGASGLVHDWRWSRQIVDAVETPVVLAGPVR